MGAPAQMAASGVDIEIDVSAAMGRPGPLAVRGRVRAGATPPPGPVRLVYCLAGGRCSTGYFDLSVAGHEGYSMADHLAAAGAVVAVVDHVGIGASDRVDDLFEVRPTALAAAHAAVVGELTTRLRDGRLVPGWPPAPPAVVGLGHSMGGSIITVAQARHGCFDALVLLGHGTGLPELLTPAELALSGPDLAAVEDDIVRLARQRFAPENGARQKRPRRGAFFADDVPAAVRRAFAAQMVPLLPTCGLTSMIPGVSDAERASITVPTFFGFGDQDLTDDYLETAARYRSLTDAALYVLAGSGHCHNQAAGRKALWDRVVHWLAGAIPAGAR